MKFPSRYRVPASLASFLENESAESHHESEIDVFVV